MIEPALEETTNPVIELDSATVRLGGRGIFSDVNLTVGPGLLVAVLGPNGAGKTTLMRVILGLVRPEAGTVAVLGRPPAQARPAIGYLPQRRGFDSSTRIRGIDLVRLGLDGARWGVPISITSNARRRRRIETHRIEEVIELVGARAYAHRAIGELSGGEQQRLLIAQALVRKPRLLILDEPLDSLDLPNQTAVAALLGRICRREGITVLLVAHDVNPLLSYLDRVVYFGAGRAVVGTPREVITAENLSRLYGVPIEVLETSDGRLVVVGLPEAASRHGAHEH